MSVLEIAWMMIEISDSELVYEGLLDDDPKRRCAYIRRAKMTLFFVMGPSIAVEGRHCRRLRGFFGIGH